MIALIIIMTIAVLVAYYDDEILVAIGKVRIKLLDIWIRILSGKK